MTYPVIVICIAFAITTFLIVGWYPSSARYFQGFSAQSCPRRPSFLIDVSDLSGGEWYFSHTRIGAAIFGIRAFLSSKRGQDLRTPLEIEAAGVRPPHATRLHVALRAHLCSAHPQPAAQFLECWRLSVAPPVIT